MYFSDYESDWGNNSLRLPVRWQSSFSDNEDGYSTYRFSEKKKFYIISNKIDKSFCYFNRKVKAPKLTAKRVEERHPSPPCPHKWESHEEIDKLEQSLKHSNIKSTSKSIKREYIQETIEKTIAKETFSSNPSTLNKKSHPLGFINQTKSLSNPNLSIVKNQFSQFNTIKSESNEQHDGPKTFYHGVVSSMEQKSFDNLSSTSCLQEQNILKVENLECEEKSRNFMSVKEKVKLLEQKVDEDFIQVKQLKNSKFFKQ